MYPSWIGTIGADRLHDRAAAGDFLAKVEV